MSVYITGTFTRCVLNFISRVCVCVCVCIRVRARMCMCACAHAYSRVTGFYCISSPCYSVYGNFAKIKVLFVLFYCCSSVCVACLT